MFVFITKKEFEARRDEQFDAFMNYVDSVEEEMNDRIDGLEGLFEDVLERSTKLIVQLNTALEQNSKPAKKAVTAKVSKKKVAKK